MDMRLSEALAARARRNWRVHRNGIACRANSNHMQEFAQVFGLRAIARIRALFWHLYETI